jgi:outer membrane protein assembly factor BamB
MTTRSSAAVAALGVLTVLFGHPAGAADWNQWRGSGRDGLAPGFQTPASWPKELKLEWKVPVGNGHSSPVVAGEQVFVFSRQDDREVVRRLRLSDGRQVWSQSYPAPFEMSPYAKWHGQGPKSTPVVLDRRLYTLGIGGILSCWDAESGKQIWQHDFAKKYTKGSSLWYGAATSPMIDAGLLVTYVGGRDEGALIALDCKTGATRWQWQGDGSAYASPILVTVDGTRQIVTQSQTASIGVSADDGKLLWKMPFTTEYDQNIITPVVRGDLVVFGGTGKPTAAYRIAKADGKWSLQPAWANDKVPLYMSSPVLVGDRLVGLTQRNKGQFFALDLPSGKTLWTSDGRMGDYAALVVAGGRVLAQTDKGELIVFDPCADQFRPLARYKIADKPTWAHPAVVGRQIVVKDRDSLALWTVASERD